MLPDAKALEVAATMRAVGEVDSGSDGTGGPFTLGEIVANTYRLERVLGSGGMGVVYEATDLLLPRSVALKAARADAPRDGLRNEAQALAALRHPAFTTVHHFGCHRGIEFFVMDRLFGETLESRLATLRAEGKALGIAEIVDLLITISDGLSAAHRAGISHRDLKPSNIVLAGERVVLIDLGLFIPEVLVGPDNLAAGSVYSMAPEVALGEVTRGQGPFIDLYALGVLAFELLTGAPPFVGDGVRDVLRQHVEAPIPDPCGLREDTPEVLGELVRDLLAKEPGERPSSAEAVLWQLKELRGDRLWLAHRTKVLVVDDDASIGEAVKSNLEQSFPQLVVRSTTDPTAALPRHGLAPADIVVLDVDMPGLNGVEVCMALRSLPRNARPAIVVMSANAGPHDISVLAELGVTSFFPKDEALFAAIGNMVGQLRCGPR